MDKNLVQCAQHRKKGATCSKYISNLFAYEKEFLKFKNSTSQFKMLEIGVSGGGSLWMWRDYFPNAIIHGIDNNSFLHTPDCKQWEDVNQNIFVHIGSQTDKAFLDKVVAKHGPFDIIIDDGGHTMDQQQTSFKHLWPTLNEKGIYVIEDLHTSYFKSHGGAILNNSSPGWSTLQFLTNLVDKLHWWAIKSRSSHKDVYDKTISELHFYDSMCFLHKDSDRIICSRETLTDKFRKKYLNE